MRVLNLTVAIFLASFIVAPVVAPSLSVAQDASACNQITFECVDQAVHCLYDGVVRGEYCEHEPGEDQNCTHYQLGPVCID